MPPNFLNTGGHNLERQAFGATGRKSEDYHDQVASTTEQGNPWGLWRRQSLWLLAILAAALAPRLMWISDMEFKLDEALIAKMVQDLAHKPWSPLAPVSAHSGVAHSSGVLYLMRAFSPTGQPLVIATSTALFNALAISLPLLWVRRVPIYLFTFALCATSAGLIVYSRKLWSPDLQAPWTILCIGLLAASRYRADFRSVLLMGLAGFCLVMAGHMYLPAAFVAAVGGATVMLVLLAQQRWKPALGWVLGAGLGWATFIPWALLVLNRAPGTHAARKVLSPLAPFNQWVDSVHMGMMAHTPFGVYERYLRPVLTVKVSGPAETWLNLTLFWVVIATAIGLSLLAVSIWSAIIDWRAATRDPMVMTAIALLILMPVALYAARLGTYGHYWLAAIPFFYYWIAWTVVRCSKRWRVWTVAACVSSLLASVCFVGLVHENGGLAGEYGPSYRVTHPAKSQ